MTTTTIDAARSAHPQGWQGRSESLIDFAAAHRRSMVRNFA